jgi:hypothetical protein
MRKAMRSQALVSDGSLIYRCAFADGWGEGYGSVSQTERNAGGEVYLFYVRIEDQR